MAATLAILGVADHAGPVGVTVLDLPEMGFVGTYSNADVGRVRRLLPKLERLATEGGQAPAPRPIRRREPPVLETIIEVLVEAGAPMRFVSIHAAVEAARGKSVPQSTVKDCLASNAQPDGRFIRIARGRYRLR